MTREQAIDEAVRRWMTPTIRGLSDGNRAFLAYVQQDTICAHFRRIMAEAIRTERSVRGASTRGSRNLRNATLSAEQASALASWAASSGRTRDPGRR